MASVVFDSRNNLSLADIFPLSNQDDCEEIYDDSGDCGPGIQSASTSTAARQLGPAEDDPTKRTYQVEQFQVTFVRTTRRMTNHKPPQVHHDHVTLVYSDEKSGGNPEIIKSINALLQEIVERKYSGVVQLDHNKTENGVLSLTHRQEQIVRHIVRGDKNKKIAAAMGITENTVKVHVYNILRRAKVKNRKDLIHKVQGTFLKTMPTNLIFKQRVMPLREVD